MTEREKEIEEIHNILFDKCPGLEEDGNLVCPRSDCGECAAMRIYDYYVLRREKEVQKETANNVISWFAFYIKNTPIDKIIEYAKEEFGVEVEE